LLHTIPGYRTLLPRFLSTDPRDRIQNSDRIDQTIAMFVMSPQNSRRAPESVVKADFDDYSRCDRLFSLPLGRPRPLIETPPNATVAALLFLYTQTVSSTSQKLSAA
jgi:hypothetical protein